MKRLERWAKVKIPRTSLWIALLVEKLGKVEKSENSQTDEDRKDHEEEKLCASQSSKSSRGTVVRDTRYWQWLEKEDQLVLCIADVTGEKVSVV